MACPHSDIRDCPLYVAAHTESGRPTCCTGDLEIGCAVTRGDADYAELIGRLSVADPRLVAMTEWNADARQRREQRERNMRAAGVH